MTQYDELIDLGTASAETLGGSIPLGDEVLGHEQAGLSND
ncbi:benenodin family lasso peptide [Novosphingobium rosa]|nr:benenodin family lasso peptide [Novosphingobium rosa]